MGVAITSPITRNETPPLEPCMPPSPSSTALPSSASTPAASAALLHSSAIFSKNLSKLKDKELHLREGRSHFGPSSHSKEPLSACLAAVAAASLRKKPLRPAADYLEALRRTTACADSGLKRISSTARHADIALKGAPPLNVFCGTWNCQYQEFPVSVLTNSKTASRMQASGAPPAGESGALPGFESLPEEVPLNVIAELDGDFCGSDDSDGVQQSGSSGHNGQLAVSCSDARLSRRGTVRRGDLVRSSTRHLRAVQGEEQPLSDWLLPGYDLYIVSLQETLGQSIFDTVTAYLTTANGVPFKRIKFQDDKLSGLGDGAWMQFKSTSLAVWVREDLEGEGMPIAFVGSKAASVSFLSGSKGGVSVCLRIWNQFFCFIGCHMPSTSPEDRRKARAVVGQRLLEHYGGASSWREAFHHVLWMGDFNFRTQRVTTQGAVTLLKKSPTGLLSFDEWLGPHGDDMRAAGFVEAPICFPPTYKKADGRPPVDMKRSKWVEDEYQTRMVTQWYKGSRQQDRIPSWTDRIFKCSVAEMASLLRFQPDLYFSALPNHPSFLIASDHSPVGLGLECFALDSVFALPDVTASPLPAKKSAVPAGTTGAQAGDPMGNSMLLAG